MSGVKIKPTIDIICQIFKQFGVNNINSEVLRLAKFNNNNDINNKRRILLALHHFIILRIVKFKRCWQKRLSYITEDIINSQCFQFISQILIQWNYNGYWNNSINDIEIRDIFLALCWLINQSDMNIFERYKKILYIKCQRINSLFKPNADLRCLLSYDVMGSRYRMKRLNEINDYKNNLNTIDQLNQIIQLVNYIRHSLNTIRECNNFRVKLQNKLRKYLKNSSIRNMLEVLLAQNQNICKQQEAWIRRGVHMLQNIKELKQHEKLWWQWVTSVVDLEMKEGVENKKKILILSNTNDHINVLNSQLCGGEINVNPFIPSSAIGSISLHSHYPTAFTPSTIVDNQLRRIKQKTYLNNVKKDHDHDTTFDHHDNNRILIDMITEKNLELSNSKKNSQELLQKIIETNEDLFKDIQIRLF